MVHFTKRADWWSKVELNYIFTLPSDFLESKFAFTRSPFLPNFVKIFCFHYFEHFFEIFNSSERSCRCTHSPPSPSSSCDYNLLNAKMRERKRQVQVWRVGYNVEGQTSWTAPRWLDLNKIVSKSSFELVDQRSVTKLFVQCLAICKMKINFAQYKKWCIRLNTKYKNSKSAKIIFKIA